MIKFQGEITGECFLWFLKRETFGGMLIGYPICLAGSIVVISLAIFYDFMILLSVLIIFIVIAILVSIPRKSEAKKLAPKLIIIRESDFEITSDRQHYYRKNDVVKKIIDYGEWYFLKMQYPHGNGTFICQKDLIKEGTIDDFEKIFEGKIRRI